MLYCSRTRLFSFLTPPSSSTVTALLALQIHSTGDATDHNKLIKGPGHHPADIKLPSKNRDDSGPSSPVFLKAM